MPDAKKGPTLIERSCPIEGSLQEVSFLQCQVRASHRPCMRSQEKIGVKTIHLLWTNLRSDFRPVWRFSGSHIFYVVECFFCFFSTWGMMDEPLWTYCNGDEKSCHFCITNEQFTWQQYILTICGSFSKLESCSCLKKKKWSSMSTSFPYYCYYQYYYRVCLPPIWDIYFRTRLSRSLRRIFDTATCAVRIFRRSMSLDSRPFFYSAPPFSSRKLGSRNCHRPRWYPL